MDVADEPEGLMRSAIFSRKVLRAYQSTCAVSGLQLLSTTGAAPLLDACHIMPWAVGHDDTIGSGLAQCPNLHRAFDRHLFWIDPDYRVRVAEGFGELGGHDYGVQRFNGQALRLLQVRSWWPRVENLLAQRGSQRSQVRLISRHKSALPLVVLLVPYPESSVRQVVLLVPEADWLALVAEVEQLKQTVAQLAPPAKVTACSTCAKPRTTCG